MSVEHTVKRGFGFTLSRQEVVDILASKGVEYDHDEPEIELQDLYPVEVEPCGSYYQENGLRFLFHAAETRNNETGSTQASPEHVATLKRMIAECNLDKTVGFCEEGLWY